jgi:hypothetical protein
MLQYLFLALRWRIEHSFLAGCGSLLAACTLVLLTTTMQTTTLQAQNIINQNARSTYDLVVVPPQTSVPAGHTVPDDLLTPYTQGISLNQYNQIKQLPGIDVAAPIAFLGYTQFSSPEIQISESPLPAGYYQVDWTLNASNGK